MNGKDRSPLFLGLYSQNCGLPCMAMAKASSLLLLFPCFVVSLSSAQTQTIPAPPPPPQPPPSNLYGAVGSRFNPSMPIVMVVLVTAFFFLGFFSVYIRQCAERRIRGGNWDAPVNLGRRSRMLTRGLNSSAIESFPTFLYSTVKGLKIGKAALECAVCLNEFEDDETLRLIPKCSHVFHPDCIGVWLCSHSTCPVCRANLSAKPSETITGAAVQVNPSGPQPENRPDSQYPSDETSIEVVNQRRDIESPDANLMNSNTMISQNRPTTSSLAGWRLTRLFQRSYSTGHSLVQPGENRDRFTLTLPEDVQSRLINSSLSRTKSCVAFPRARSSRRGYRSWSSERNYFNYESFDRWGFSMTPPFFSRTGSVQSPKPMVGGGDGDEVLATPSKGLLKSIKLPFDSLFIGGEENVGQQSSDQLLPEGQV